MAKHSKLLLWLTVGGVLLGAAAGAWLGGYHLDDSARAAWLSAAARPTWLALCGFPGEIFMNTLKLLVVPLVGASIIVGTASLGDVRKAGAIGARTIGYYMATTGVAVALGIILVTTLKPGGGVEGFIADVPADLAARVPERGSTLDAVLDVFRGMFPDNMVRAVLEMKILAVIVFSLFFGAVLTTIGDKAKPVIAFFDGLNEAIMKLVGLLMWFAPLGIASLIAAQTAASGDIGAYFEKVGRYMMTIMIGLTIHGLVILPTIYALLTRKNPFRFLMGMAPAILTAFGTSSSSATLPVTLECARENNNISERTASFVLPLGATINMDGTALYEAVAVIFIAQAIGVELGIGGIIIVALTATLASIGAAGIPSAGIVTMVMIVGALNLPIEGIAYILAVDWFLDRFRTAVNVAGDAVGAAVVDRYERRTAGT